MCMHDCECVCAHACVCGYCVFPPVCVGVCVYLSKQDEALCESRSAIPRVVQHLKNTSLLSSLFCCYI